MVWLQISVEVTGELAAVATEVFEDAGALSVTYQDAADEPILEPPLGEHPVWSATRVVALFPGDSDACLISRRLRETLHDDGIGPRIEPLEDRDWSSTWRDGLRAMRFGARLWVVPADEPAPAADAVAIHLDPGLAFGTGTHTTTALCLEWLDAYPPLDLEVIDYGCGSGILAIAAGKLGASRVRAVDIDPQALQATRANAGRNGMGRKVDAIFADALDTRPVDLLIANILANPLIELSETLANQVSEGGRVVLTGILREQAGDVMTAYQPWFDFGEPVEREGWMLLEGVKRTEQMLSRGRDVAH
jgi:ribosomal protein L11 methyltransferase